MRTIKHITLLMGCIFLPSVYADVDCRAMIESELQTRYHANILFPVEMQTVMLVLCKPADEPIYQWLYTYLHAPEKHRYGPSSGALNKVKLPFNPNPSATITGVVLGDNDHVNQFTVQLRLRVGSGQALDISQSLELAFDKPQIFEQNGLIIGALRLAK